MRLTHVTKLRVMEYTRTLGLNPSLDADGNIHLRICENLYSTAEEKYNEIKKYLVLKGYLDPITWEWEDKLAKRRKENERRKSTFENKREERRNGENPPE